MYCVMVCVVLTSLWNVMGMPVEENKKNFEELITDIYGPPPEPHISHDTDYPDRPPIPQKDMDTIFGTPTLIKSNEELLWPDEPTHYDYPTTGQNIIPIENSDTDTVWPTELNDSDYPSEGQDIIPIKKSEYEIDEDVLKLLWPDTTPSLAEDPEVQEGTVSTTDKDPRPQENVTSTEKPTTNPNGACKHDMSTFLVVFISLFILFPL